MDRSNNQCNCRSGSTDRGGFGTGGAAESLIQFCAAFASGRDENDTPARVALANQIQAAAIAMDSLGRGLLSVDTMGRRGRDRLADQLGPIFCDAAAALSAAGATVTDGNAAACDLQRGARLLTDGANLLQAVDVELAAATVFPVYASVLAKPALALSTLAGSLDGSDDDIQLASAQLTHAAVSGATVMDGFMAAGSSFELVGQPRKYHPYPPNGEPVPAIPDPCAGCPEVGTTIYCTDTFLGIIGQTRFLGITAVRWDVRTIMKTVACCYKSQWDRFWAIDCCNKTVTLSPPVRSIARRTYIGAPPAAPFSEVRLC